MSDVVYSIALLEAAEYTIGLMMLLAVLLQQQARLNKQVEYYPQPLVIVRSMMAALNTQALRIYFSINIIMALGKFTNSLVHDR